MNDKQTMADYTELEFLELINSIINVENFKNEEQRNKLILKFRKLCVHPAKADLIFWPEAEGLDSPENIVRIIKDWCAANGKPGFRPE